MSSKKKRRKRKNKTGLIVLFIIEILLLVGIAVFFLYQYTLGQINRTSTRPESVVDPADVAFDEDDASANDTIAAEDVDFNSDAVQVMEDGDVKNILLIGQDRREGQGRQRSDSMIILSINTNTNSISLVSLMRDMYVPIPGYDANRINAAYVYGGMELLDETIEQDFGVAIDGNIEVDFDGFIESLAAVGNIEIELTAEEAEYLNTRDWSDAGIDNSDWTLTEGVNELTPEQALSYARTRDIGNSDYERTERQRKVIMAAFEKVKGSSLIEMATLCNKILPNLTTDMGDIELLGYAKTLVSNNITEMNSYRLPVDGTYTDETIRGMAVLVPDLSENSAYLQEYIYGDGSAEAE